MEMKVLIIGHGVVGSNVHKVFPEADVHDPAQGLLVGELNEYDVGFVCVPTEMLPDGSADVSLVQAVVKEWREACRVLCIRSTVPPGTTKSLKGPCVFQPEFYGATPHANNPTYNYVILGGSEIDTEIVAEAYREVSSATLRILLTDTKTAELLKYMENSWLATKVVFCNEFARIAEAYGVSYTQMRELFLHDPRINPSHTFVYRRHPYYDSHCLNKDVPAIVKASTDRGYAPSLLRSVIDINEGFKNDGLF